MSQTPADLPLEINCRGAQALLRAGSKLLLLDCREPAEFEIARLEGARLMPLSELAARGVAELEDNRESPIVVYCHHGARSLWAAQWLRQHGFPLVQSMAGGIDAWSTEIDPAVPRY